MGERRGITVKTSEERYFEYDQIAIQATERVDINVHDVGDATTAGPIVALIGE
jgi:HK97 family phage major capsid protein